MARLFSMLHAFAAFLISRMAQFLVFALLLVLCLWWFSVHSDHAVFVGFIIDPAYCISNCLNLLSGSWF